MTTAGRPLRVGAITLAAILLTGAFMYLRFPYDRLADAVAVRVERASGWRLQITGLGPHPMLLGPGPLTLATAGLASALRPGLGALYRRSTPPAEPLELYSFEASPFCRIVRESLSSLEIPYLLHNVAKDSPGREVFAERSGRMLVPYLIDPNTGIEMFESSDIVHYLEETYAAAAD